MQPQFDVDSVAYDDRGLVPVIAQDIDTLEIKMMAWMNREALSVTLDTGQVTYWSRSRQSLWVKGATSGHKQQLVELRIDCDRDCLLVLIRQTGPACHTGRRNCFYRAVRSGGEVEIIAKPTAG